MTTPLQQAAQAMIDRWESPDWKDTPHTAHYVAELRKALYAEIAQTKTGDRNLRVTELAMAVEPVAWLTQAGSLASAEIADSKMGMSYGWTPLYMHPPQPQATPPAVPDGYVLVPAETLLSIKGRVNTLATLSLKADRYRVGIAIKQTIADILAAAQGEKPRATTPVVPEGYVLVPVEPTPAMCAEGLEDEGLTIKDGFKYAYALYKCMVKTAQGEKP